MRRRAFLVGISALVAGCSGREDTDALRPTVTPVEVPADPRIDGAAISIGDSRFDDGAGCPDGVSCFHRLEDRSRPAFVAPSRERFTARDPVGWMYVTNGGASDLAVGTGWDLFKYSGHRWVPITAPQVGGSELSVLESGEHWRRVHVIERLFGLPVLGPGLYARVESVRLQGEREPRAIGALFEVSGTRFRMKPNREPTARDADSVRIQIGRPAGRELVFERVGDATGSVELVPEAVGSIPMFRDSIPRLREVSTVRVGGKSTDAAFAYLDSATVRDEAVEPGWPLVVDGVTFTARIVERNR